MCFSFAEQCVGDSLANSISRSPCFFLRIQMIHALGSCVNLVLKHIDAASSYTICR